MGDAPARTHFRRGVETAVWLGLVEDLGGIWTVVLTKIILYDIMLISYLFLRSARFCMARVNAICTLKGESYEEVVFFARLL